VPPARRSRRIDVPAGAVAPRQGRTITVTRGTVDGIANDGECHPFEHANEALEPLQRVRANAKGIVGGVSVAASTIAWANKFDYDRYVKQIHTRIGNMTVAAPWNELSEKAKELAGPWTVSLTLGSVALYLLSYLSLRFHLTTLGVGTDLSILDERYLFAGAKFLVYQVSSVPNAAVVGLLLLLLGAFLSLPYRLLPHTFRTQVRSQVGDWWACFLTWWALPGHQASAQAHAVVPLLGGVSRLSRTVLVGGACHCRGPASCH